jgi:large subunit ribosomal protein L15
MDLKTLYTPPTHPEQLPLQRRKRKKRVGRGIGSGHGKTSTRGSKGQWASAGAKKPTQLFEGGQMQLFRRMPKRGFSHATWDRHYHVVNVGDLNQAFEDGAVVDQEALKKVGLAKGPADGVRILGTGDLNKALTIRANHFSASAREKITASGGTMDLIPPPKKPKRNKMKTKQAKTS